jgi:hypothetical protein
MKIMKIIININNNFPSLRNFSPFPIIPYLFAMKATNNKKKKYPVILTEKLIIINPIISVKYIKDVTTPGIIALKQNNIIAKSLNSSYPIIKTQK